MKKFNTIFDSFINLNPNKNKKTLDDKVKNPSNNQNNNVGNIHENFEDLLDENISHFKQAINDDKEILKKLYKNKWNNYTWGRVKKRLAIGAVVASISFGMYNYLIANNQEKHSNQYVTQNQTLERTIENNNFENIKPTENNDNKVTYTKESEKKIETSIKPIVKDYKNLNKRLEEALNKQGKSKNTYFPIPNVIIPKPAYASNNNNNNNKQDKITKIVKANIFHYFPLRGDTLGDISKETTGSVNNWKEIQKYNDLPSDLIEVNQPLRIPTHLVQNSSKLYKGNIDCKIYFAKENDSLESISRKIYGSSNKANKILNYNRKLNPSFNSKLWNKEYIFIPKI